MSIPVQAESPRVDRARVEEVIAIIRPAIQADKGDIRLVDVDEEAGIIKVELQGACVSCPASTQTLKAGIERHMELPHLAPEPDDGFDVLRARPPDDYR